MDTRLDLARLRKDLKISQKELASRLDVRQSFLSAVENGRSPLPADKRARLAELFPDIDLGRYSGQTPGHDHSHSATSAGASLPMDMAFDGNVITQLFNHFHAQLHRESDSAQQALLECVKSLERRNDALTERNDNLASYVETLRAEIDALRAENYRLKEQLLKRP